MKWKSLILALIALQWLFSLNTYAQDYARFLEVKKWSVSFTMVLSESYFYPDAYMGEFNKISEELVKDAYEMERRLGSGEDISPWGKNFANFHVNFILFASDIKNATDGYSYAVENSRMNGNLLFNRVDPASVFEDYKTWLGNGKISIVTNHESEGKLSGADFEGSLNGGGFTKLNSDESWFEIDPESGTYELFLTPGDGEKSGIMVNVFSRNNVWKEISRTISEKLDHTSAEALNSLLPELLENNEGSETGDLFYYSDPDKWIVDIESAQLPRTGLVIKGEKQVSEGHTISWTIEPANN